MQMKKAMLKRITEKMSVLKQLESMKTQQPIETVKRVITKDFQGHVVKYLARRMLQYSEGGVSCNICKKIADGPEEMKELDFFSCQECDFDCCKECRKQDFADDPICIEARHFCKFQPYRKGYHCFFCGKENSEGMWCCENEGCQYDVCNNCI